MQKQILGLVAFSLMVMVGFGQTNDLVEINQEQTNNLNKEQYWVDAGLGFFVSTKDAAGLSLNLGANVIYKNIYAKLKTSYYSAMSLGSNAPLEKYFSAGILVGKVFFDENISIQLSGGLGITRLNLLSHWQDIQSEDGTYVSQLSEQEIIFTPSIPLEVNFMVKPLKSVGMGFSVFADLNIKRPMCGVTLKLAFGRM
ncbi:MAG: hypothetical protein WC951_00660 [Bacteroidales bacterium]|nr:hypothetical protein [Tenuifilaceae bacterium]